MLSELDHVHDAFNMLMGNAVDPEPIVRGGRYGTMPRAVLCEIMTGPF